MSSTSRHVVTSTLAGAFALVLAATLTGCGAKPAESTPQEAEEQQEAAAGEVAEGEIAIPETLETSARVALDIAETGDTSAAEDFDTLPTSDDADAPEVTDIDVATDEDAKASSNAPILQANAIQLTLPNNWVYTILPTVSLFSSSDYEITGIVQDCNKPANVDVETLAKSVPGKLRNEGYDVSVVDCKVGYSTSGKPCSCWILVRISEGGAEDMEYVHYIESKSYLTLVNISGSPEAFSKHLNEISEVTSSICFLQGEEI